MKTLALTLSLFLIAGAAAVSNAAPQSQSTPQQAEAKAVNAKVITVDAEKNVISVKDAQGADLALRVAASTKISKAGKAITIAEIQTGDSIVFELDASDQSVAKIIAVLPG